MLVVFTALVALLALVAGCGARLDENQRLAATRSGGGTGTGGSGGPAGAVAAGSTATSVISAGGPAAQDPAAAAVTTGGDTGPAVSGPQEAAAGDGGCAPTGSASDVGVTADRVTLGSVAVITGPVPGLFKNVQSGVKAYLAYTNSTGGVCGRQLDVVLSDDRLDAGVNRAEHEKLKPQVFAFVGGYSVVDDGGAAVLEGTGIPDIGSAIGPRRASMPENFATTPNEPTATSNGAVPIFQWFMQNYGVSRATVVWPAQADARKRGVAFANDMAAAGLQVIDPIEVAVTETNYTGVAAKMKENQIELFITVLEVNGMAKIAQALRDVGYQPKVSYFGQQAYGEKFLQLAGNAGNGALMALHHSIIEDRAANPEMDTFVTWYQRTNPGEQIDFFSIQGWLAGSMFVDALRQAGPDPTRAKVFEILRTFTSWDAHGLIAANNPPERRPADCFMVVTIENQQWKRVTPESGFMCP